jgi:hypothetical protein
MHHARRRTLASHLGKQVNPIFLTRTLSFILHHI